MINFQLITKISGYDSGFRRQIIDMIAIRFSNIDREMHSMIEDHKCVAVELLLTEYLLEISPYTQLGAINRLRDMLNRMKTADDAVDKASHACAFLSMVGEGIEDARRAVLNPTVDSAYRASA